MNKYVKEFLENPYWEKQYNNMPNERLKMHCELGFIFSLADEEESNRAHEESKSIEEQFTAEDWQYLIDNTPNIQAKVEYSKRLKALQEK